LSSSTRRVAVFTTSYPQDENDFAGRFVYDLVERLRARGLEVARIVWPRSYGPRRDDVEAGSILEARTEARTRCAFPAYPAHLTRVTMRSSLNHAAESGPGRIRTSDLRIKSPPRQAVENCKKRKAPAQGLFLVCK
jgi:hypothetical protein